MSKIKFEDCVYYKSGHFVHNFIEKSLIIKSAPRTFVVINSNKDIVRQVKSKKNDSIIIALKIGGFVGTLGIAYLALLVAKKIERSLHSYSIVKTKGKVGTTGQKSLGFANPAEKQQCKIDEWNEKFKAVVNDAGKQRCLRAELYKETQKFCREGFYIGNDHHFLDKATTAEMIEKTVSEDLSSVLDLSSLPDYDTEISIVDKDVCDLAKEFKDSGLNPVALNLANAHQPGGGVRAGCGAQEESIFRRSNYFQATEGRKKAFYPINKGTIIYTPKVQVFRTRESDLTKQNPDSGYQVFEPYTLDFIAAAAFDLRHEKLTKKEFMDGTRANIRCILMSALKHGHDSIVLGALGAGAFKNDPATVATLFKEALEGEFKNKFKKVTFAIIFGEDKTDNKGQVHKGLLNVFTEILT